jgi:type IX secretion system PorP/SprF family membrane protein
VKKIFVIIVFILFGFSSRLLAQIDPHFSQYYAYPIWLNPALTGAIDSNSVRANINYKNQYPTVNNAYKTGALSVDFRPTEKVGLGFMVVNQSAGTAGFNYLAAYGSFAYTIKVSDNGYQQMHFGVQAGFINRSFDPSKSQLDDQYNPGSGYDPGLPSFENFSSTSAAIFDAGAGVFYANSDPSTKANVFAGVSVNHLSQPRDPFATEGINSKLPMRYTVHGGVHLNISDFLNLTPHLLYIRQHNNDIKALGLYADLNSTDAKGLILGAMYRLKDAAVAEAGYRFNNMVLGFSYDFNTSPLHSVASSRGGIELSLSYTFHTKSHRSSNIYPSF